MIFYIITDADGSVFDCTTKLAEAKQIAIDDGGLCVVTRLDVDVSAETIRRLLGNHGGYAKSSKEVLFVKGEP